VIHPSINLSRVVVRRFESSRNDLHRPCSSLATKSPHSWSQAKHLAEKIGTIVVWATTLRHHCDFKIFVFFSTCVPGSQAQRAKHTSLMRKKSWKRDYETLWLINGCIACNSYRRTIQNWPRHILSLKAHFHCRKHIQICASL